MQKELHFQRPTDMKGRTYLENSRKMNTFYKLLNLTKDVSSGRILGYLEEYKGEFGLCV